MCVVSALSGTHSVMSSTEYRRRHTGRSPSRSPCLAVSIGSPWYGTTESAPRLSGANREEGSKYYQMLKSNINKFLHDPDFVKPTEHSIYDRAWGDDDKCSFLLHALFSFLVVAIVFQSA